MVYIKIKVQLILEKIYKVIIISLLYNQPLPKTPGKLDRISSYYRIRWQVIFFHMFTLFTFSSPQYPLHHCIVFFLHLTSLPSTIENKDEDSGLSALNQQSRGLHNAHLVKLLWNHWGIYFCTHLKHLLGYSTSFDAWHACLFHVL